MNSEKDGNDVIKISKDIFNEKDNENEDGGFSSDEKHTDKHAINAADNVNIVKSNLNRQFLFRKENIGEQKSKITC